MKFVAIVALLSLTPLAASAADVAMPEKAAVCAACHGEAGRSVIPANPVLAGQYANYLEHAMLEYQSGKRKNAIMAAQMTGLTKSEIKQLAQYYAAQKSDLYTPSIHGALKP